MPERLITYSLILLGCLGLLLAANLLRLSRTGPADKYLNHNNVSGIAVEHQGLLYTLNFEQQNAFIDLLNRAVQITKEGVTTPSISFNFSKIVVYPLKGKEVVLNPVENSADGFIAYSAQLFPDGYLKDTSQGQLLKLITQTYDP